MIHALTSRCAGRSGGALLASALVNLHDCLLLGNHARVRPAVAHKISVSFSFVDFINNTLWCDDSALYLDWNDVSDNSKSGRTLDASMLNYAHA